jgi:hypothetical protein
VFKILDCSQVSEVPLSIKQLQEQLKEDTVNRMITLREQRKSRQQQAMDVFVNMLHERHTDQINSKYSENHKRISNLSKTLINGKNMSTPKGDGKIILGDRAGDRAGDRSPNHGSCERTVAKIKDALYRAGLLGRLKFSVFYDKNRPSNTKNFSTRTFKNSITADLQTPTMDLDS